MTNSTFKNLGKSKGVKRVFGAVMATALAMAGVTVVNSAESGGNSCEPEIVSVNPMGASTPIGSADGYTIFVKDDAIFANSEIEGTIAVGGTATFGDPRGFQSPQYPIMHSTGAGNNAYGVPIIDGKGNRVLLNEIAFSGNKVVQIKNQGSVGDAGAKLFNQDSPENYTFGPQFGGSGTTYFPTGGGNQSPQLESQVQAWADGAGAGTFTPGRDAFTDYFPADEGATILAGYTDWATPEIQAGGEARIKLDGSKPSQISLSDFGNAEKFFVENYNEDSFLVVKITAADLSNGILKLPSIGAAGKQAPDNEQLSHVLWDLSELNGDVTIKTINEPARGAIYAPNAHVIFPAENDGGKEFEGQIISNKFTALQGGKEIHTNLFKGRFTTEKPCEETPEGGFSLKKVVEGVDEADLDGKTFTVTASWEGGSKELTLDADGSVVAGPQDLPAGTVVSFAEGSATAIEGYTFGGVEFDPESVTITDGGNTVVTVTNTYTKEEPKVGGFSLKKVVEGVDEADLDGKTFTVTASWEGGSKELTLDADGSVVAGPQDLPAGTVVTFSEGSSTAIEGYVFGGVVFDPESVTITEGGNPVVTVTNTYTKEEPKVGGFSLKKVVEGVDEADLDGKTFTVTATWEDGSKELTLDADGTVVDGPQDLPAGTVVTFSEGSSTAIEGYVFGGVVFSPGSVTITDGGNTEVTVTNTYTEIPEPEPGKGQITVTKIVDPSVKELVGETEFQFTLRCEAFEVITPLAVAEDEEASASEIEAAAELLNAIADLTSDETLDENGEISFVLKAGESKTFDIPAGMNCTIEEVEPNAIEGITWDGVTFEVNEVEINTIEVIEGQNVSVKATNTYTKTEEPKVGGFSLKKVVEGVDEADLDGKSFTVTASWEGGSKELILDADGSVVAGPQDLPVGTVVSFAEGSGTAIEGYVFGGVEFDPESVTISESGNPVVTVTNTYTKEDQAAEPWIGTTAEVKGAEDKVLPITGGTVIDTVEYTNLRPETEYRLEGKLVHVDADGNVTDIDVTASATFTTGAATEGNPYYVSGTTTLEFQIDEATAKQYAGENLVVFEKVFLVGEGAPEEPVATHEDPEDEAQTFEVESGRDIEVVKSVTGPKGDQVTADEDAAFQIEATWTDRLGNAQSKVFNVIPGQPVVLEGLPLNTEITLTEVGASTSVGNVKWADIIWSGEGVVDGEGDSASATITLTKGEAPVGVGLENKTSANGLIIIPLPIPLFPGGGSSEPPAPTEPVSPVSPEEPVAPVKPGESAKPSAPAKPGETQVPDKGTPSKGGLANTGANVAWLAGGAVLLLLVGAWLTLRGRRNIK